MRVNLVAISSRSVFEGSSSVIGDARGFAEFFKLAGRIVAEVGPVARLIDVEIRASEDQHR
jgi:hypothetical protein